MSTCRLAALPLDHIVAEMAAYPLSSETALRLGATRLDPLLDDRRGQKTAELWRQAEREVLGGFPAFSVDEVLAIRDRLWFRDQGISPVPLTRYLRLLADEFLEVWGATARPRLLPEPRPPDLPPPSDLIAPWCKARRAWRWLSFALPPDLLLAALTRSQDIPCRVQILSPNLEQMLKDRGFAETHLHIGAAVEFPLVWIAALRKVGGRPSRSKAARRDDFASPGAVLDEGRRLGPWILGAGLARQVLAGFLAARQRDPLSFPELSAYISTVVNPGLAQHQGLTAVALFQRGLCEVAGGRLNLLDSRFPRFQDLYARLAGLASRFPDDLDAAQAADPIAKHFPPLGAESATPEMLFVAASLAYLEDRTAGNAEDEVFTCLFWQVVRVRAVLYRHLVQRPMTPGLQWFVRFYDRIGRSQAGEGGGLSVASAARSCGQARGLRSLEVRTAPKGSRSILLKMVRSWHKAGAKLALNPRGEGSGIEFGVVFHLPKDRGGQARSGKNRAHWTRSNADPAAAMGLPRPADGVNPSGYRYATFYQELRNQALNMAWILQHYPLTLQLLRGIDVCTDELGVPTWVIAPLFRYLRSTGEWASSYLCSSGVVIPPLRTTAHTGEDFVHLLGGLRRIDEALRHLGLREGDRLGHGVSLGIDPRDWAARAGRLPVMREERLLDLSWEWSFYRRESLSPTGDRILRISEEIGRLTTSIFGERLEPWEVEAVVEILHSDGDLRRVGFPDRPGIALRARWHTETDRHSRLLRHLYMYLTDPVLFRRGRVQEWVDPSAESEVLAALQDDLRRKVGARGIAVEVNPSSNLLIGNMGDLEQHPLWRLDPPRRKEDYPLPIDICIGSDDPLTFATTLPGEYQLVCDSLNLAGLSEAEVQSWIDRVRENGLRARFTLPRLSNLEILSIRVPAGASIPAMP